MRVYPHPRDRSHARGGDAQGERQPGRAVGASMLDSYRATGPLRWRIPEDASKRGKLELDLHVSHRFMRSAWIDSVPELTVHPLGGASLAAVHSFNTVSAIGALTAAAVRHVFYAVLFVSLRDTRRASYGGSRSAPSVDCRTGVHPGPDPAAPRRVRVPVHDGGAHPGLHRRHGLFARVCRRADSEPSVVRCLLRGGRASLGREEPVSSRSW